MCPIKLESDYTLDILDKTEQVQVNTHIVNNVDSTRPQLEIILPRVLNNAFSN